MQETPTREATAKKLRIPWSQDSLHYKGDIYNQFLTLGQSPEEILEQLISAAKLGLPTTLTILAESRKPPQSLPSTQEIIDAYLIYMEDGGAAEGYLKVRARKLRFFARQHPQLSTDHEEIRTYLRQFKTSDVPTRQDQWKALKALYDFVYRKNPDDNPMLEVVKPHFKKKPGKRLSCDQAKIYIAAIKTDLEWALVTLYLGLRFRKIEAERLLSDDIKSDYILVRGKERGEELPLLSIFREMLLRVERHGHNGHHFPINADTMAYHIEQVGKRAGFKVTPHMLRNTAGRLWLTYGGDDRANRQLLRHSNRTMTDHYSTLSLDELMAMDERHNPMLNLMRGLGLAPVEEVSPYQNTTGVQVSEADPARLLPQLLDQMITLGHRADELSQALGGNGHHPEQLKEIMRCLEHQASN